MEQVGYDEPFHINDGKIILHHLASQSEVESKGEAVMAAWEDLFDSDSLRRPASWIDLPIEAPTVPGLPNGWTALDLLVNNKARVRPRMVQMLLESRADMTRRRPGGSGQMPLHAAVSTGNEVVVDILLEAKADPFVLNGNGSSCVDLAHANVALKQKFRDVLKVHSANPVGAVGRCTPIVINVAAALSQFHIYACEFASRALSQIFGLHVNKPLRRAASLVDLRVDVHLRLSASFINLRIN